MRLRTQLSLFIWVTFTLSLQVTIPNARALEFFIPQAKTSSVTQLPQVQFRHRRYLVEFKNASLPKEEMAYFSPKFKLNKDGQMVFEIKMKNHFKHDSLEAHALKEILKATIEKTDYPEQALERYSNLSQQDDALTKIDFLEILIDHFSKNDLEIASYAHEQLLPRWRQILAQQRSLARQQNQKRLSDKQNRRSRLDRLDQDRSRQLKDLVAQNKRAQVADLLRQYLPWEEMALTEKKYWLTSLEAIRNPVTKNQRVILYRGLDSKNNKLHWGNYHSAKRPFIFSVMLDKNQGSYNRRLRSLETMYSKRISATQTKPRLELRYSRSQRLTNIAKNHSEDPLGSPLLSYSSDLRVAKQFSEQGLIVVALDPRLLLPGSLSPFNENEWLTPLLTFPDETLLYLDNVEALSEENLWDEIQDSLQEVYQARQARLLVTSLRQKQIPIFLSTYQFQTLTRPFYFELSKGNPSTPRPVTEYQKLLYNLQ